MEDDLKKKKWKTTSKKKWKTTSTKKKQKKTRPKQKMKDEQLVLCFTNKSFLAEQNQTCYWLQYTRAILVL